ncbi:condensin complex subunit SMC1 [Exidia glandulosa HHB12029]|uniref:Structural maintenance of chromosomes protein n=2 Tax=Exidia glandulosa HHB12029 TaxID=1314781 RepID=A0A165ZA69_EXIGL|nr:condensin complex subunit SMC1 [Exidia glandulosa HHB12029]
MPLLRIEVCDFKSYRGQQVIGPFSTFTSVIGPNGAGKSNLMDAISFVLGVKSMQLRSSQLKDLIYRGRRLAEGTQSQSQNEPAGEGDATKAWVRAILEDKDGNELTFQRTVSINGASEYRLNNRVVTYQAYNTALEDQNILVKAKNFLVFQGDVEAIASQSPKDLSRLIEQISGSLDLAGEYERAKAAQERATENATFNFTKRRGIAGEIKQFKEQKAEAERFQKLVDERDHAVLERLLWKLYHIEERIENNTREIKKDSKVLGELRAQQTHNDEAAETARVAYATARSEVITREKRIKKQEKALEKKQPDLLDIEAKIAHAERKAANATKMIETINADVTSRETKIAQQRKEMAAVRKAADAAAEEQRKASTTNLSLSQESLDEYRRLEAAAALEAVSERQQLEQLGREEKTDGRVLAGNEAKLAEFEKTQERLETEVEQEKEKKNELDEKLRTASEDWEKVKAELDKLHSERTRIAKLEKEINEKLNTIHHDLLQAGVDQRESEREARLKDTLASLQRVFPGVRGRVVDLCKPTQRKYETAVSVVLGRNIDAVVVDTEKTAIECIEYMRNQRAGQATFIPLDTIQVKPINDKYRSFAKGARLAVDIIQFDPAVERAMHHACGNALVCDTMDVARFVCWEKGQEVKAVTLQGTIIHKSGLITGGQSLHNSKKWEEKEVQNLRRARESLMQQLQELSKQKPRSNADEPLQAENSRLESQMALLRDDLSVCKHSLTGKKDELKHVQREIKKLRPVVDKARADRNALKKRMEDLASVVHAAEDKIFAAFCDKIGVPDIRAYRDHQLRATQEAQEARLRFDKQLARMTHVLKFDEEELVSLQERLANMERAGKGDGAGLVKLKEQRDALRQELDGMRETIEKMQKELEKFNEGVEEQRKELEDLKKTAAKSAKALDKVLKDIATKNDEIEQAAIERSGIYRKCKMEKIELPLLKGKMTNVPMEENLRDEVAMDVDDEDGTQQPKTVQDYGIEVNFDTLDDEEREDGSPEMAAQLDGAIVKLTTEIERLVPNMKATNRLDDVENKLAETEREAEQARKESKTTRDDFNTVKKQRCDLFNKAYSHISDCIDQVYKDLTKGKAAPMGGVAYLSLEDSDEPYLGGIKYHAMPPMKRFRDMEQLSGGEKTVAALALLFAIHSYQPAPFFVLDEVDAALDNTNVAKIANYIQAHASEAFQFIVISLKGSLYERGRSLVGVYRDQDLNSSRSLTLDLTQYAKD